VWWLRGCPRCRGTLTDQYSYPRRDRECVNCGHVVYASTPRISREQLMAEWQELGGPNDPVRLERV